MKLGLFFFILICASLSGLGQSCTLSVNLNSTGTSICSGNSLVITAAASSGTGPYTYSWSTGETTSSISVNKAGTYTVTVSDQTAGCPGVKKSITITSNTTPAAPTVSDVAVCQNTSATLTATAPGGVYQWYDTNGSFLFTGATYTTQPIATQTVFYVETTLSGCTSPRSMVTVYVYGSPGVNNTTVCQGNVATLSAVGYPNYVWYDAASGGNQVNINGGATYITPVLSTTTTYFVSGVINGCTTPRAPVTAFVTQAPQPPTALNVTICAGQAANLHANAPSGIIDWFSVPSGGASLITSPDFTTPALTATTTYYAQVNTGCLSTRTPVTVTVNQIPSAPTVSPVSVCPGTSAHLTATTNITATFNWYTQSSGGNAIATGNTFDTPVLTRPATYYVDAANGNCSSARTAITVGIATPPNAPTAAGALICSGSSAMLTATAPGGVYQWFSTPTGGTPLVTNASYTTPALITNTTYYVQTTSSTTGCTSSRTAVVVNIIPVTPAPTATGTTICAGNSATLTAIGGNSYQWFNVATGGTPLATTANYITPSLSTNTTYYVQNTANGCASLRTAVNVTVTPLPAAPVLSSNGPVCVNTTATLTATGNGTINWYSAATGGSPLATGNTFITPPLAANTTYYADNTSSSCPSNRTAITVNVIVTPNPQFKYASNTVCTTAPNTIPTIYSAGGTFSASPAGLVFVSTSTGEINIAASAAGVYTILYSNGGLCPASNSVRFAITPSPNATFSYAGPYCQDAVNPVPVFPTASSGAGVFSASPSGLVFVSTGSGQIDLQNSAPGTYNITNDIFASGSCAASTYTTQVTIYQQVMVNAGPNQTVASGVPVQLAGSVTGGTTTGAWTGGAGSFSSASSPTATYTPAPGETSATLTLTSADPPGPCGPKSATVTITFTAAPAAPTALGTTICTGNNAVLSATGPGGTYNWYAAASGGAALFTGADFTTPALTTTTTYYVSATVNNVASARTAVTVTVSAAPTAPVVNASPVCMGNTATLNATGSAGSSFTWYNDAAGINKIATGSSYTTGALNANTTFYVQAAANGCTSAITQVDVVVSPLPNITSNNANDACSGMVLNYTITADVPTATFLWSRPAVTGISNPAATNQTSATITEALINTTTNPIDVTYNITPSVNGCSGQLFIYIVTVYPTPVVTSVASTTICNGTSTEYAITFNIPQTGFNWSRTAVVGISNAAVSGQTAATLHEVLFNTTNAPINVTYIYNYTTGPCAGTTFNFLVTVNPNVNITSAATGSICNGAAQNYAITSNVASASFSWSRPAFAGNPAASGNTSSITETLINNTANPISVNYTITPMAFGCTGAAFIYKVTVNPIPVTPIANSNSPVCVGSTVQLRTPAVINASYLWTGPNGYTSTLQNPDILNVSTANTGNYQLFVTVNGCTSPAARVAVSVDEPPVANAGPNQTVCTNIASVQLAGSVTGGTTTGIWGTVGSGTFSPSESNLNAQYIPSAADKTAGSVTLTLASTSKDDCSISSSSMTITFAAVPAADAGPDQEVCAQTAGVALNGKILINGGGVWSTSGTGTFSPSAAQANATYVPGAADIKAGNVTLTLTASGANACYIPADQMNIKFIPPPTLNAGGTRFVLKGNTLVLTPTVSDENVTYLWSPNISISNVTVKNPVITGDSDRVYTLTITDSRGCVSTDKVSIKVSPAINVYNTFTPNGDGNNDTWNIVGLDAYHDAVVDIFNRNGTHLYHSIGYPAPWDGNSNGKPLPAGVYFYIIDTRVNNQVLSGSVTIVR